MPLISCPECNNMISEYADACVYCGCPMNKIKELCNNSKNDNLDENVEDELNNVVTSPPKTFNIFELIGTIPEEDRMSIEAWLDEGMALDYKNSKLSVIDCDSFYGRYECLPKYEDYTEEELDEVCCNAALKQNETVLKQYGMNDYMIKRLIDKWKSSYWFFD